MSIFEGCCELPVSICTEQLELLRQKTQTTEHIHTFRSTQTRKNDNIWAKHSASETVLVWFEVTWRTDQSGVAAAMFRHTFMNKRRKAAVRFWNSTTTLTLSTTHPVTARRGTMSPQLLQNHKEYMITSATTQMVYLQV